MFKLKSGSKKIKAGLWIKLNPYCHIAKEACG